MKRIAIASCYDKYNYGSALQAYATQVAIQDLGIKPVTLDKRGLRGAIGRGRRDYYRRNLFNFDMYKAKKGLGLFALRRRLDSDLKANVSERRKAFDDFVVGHIDLSPSFSTFEETEKYCEEFDCVVVGSDQLWLPVNIAGNYFTLSFVPSPVRKVSYATSFGLAQLPPYYEMKARQFLETFDAISTREESGRAIVESLGLEAEVVCDPTMLLAPEKWSELAESSGEVFSSPYIFCYFLGNNPWQRECVRTLKQRLGCPVVALSHLDEYIASDNEGFADYQPYDVSPLQWVNLIKGASFIMTDSFHGTVFATLFNRPFITFRRHANVGNQSTNSRLDTLLERLRLQSRICNNKSELNNLIDASASFDSVNKRIDDYKNESLLWLKHALEIA